MPVHHALSRKLPLDLIPRLIVEEEWQELERGIVQRVKALEALLADVYGAGRIFADGVIPRHLVTSSEHFHREAWGIEPPNGVRVHVAGIDVVRGGDGHFYVLEDNLRCPSGVSYVIENRRMMARIFPELFASHRVTAVDGYPAKLLEALRAAAPPGVVDPTVVVMTPGVYNSAFFEHSFLARQMGVELVEGRDLLCHSGHVYMRTSDGERQVHVIYRRVDDEFLDPLHFRSDSLVGCPGYVYPEEEVTVGAAVPAESHAWVEYWVGDWVAVDPTAGTPVSNRHVLVARGRDYSDVAPVKGIFNGGPTSGMQVEVKLTPLA